MHIMSFNEMYELPIKMETDDEVETSHPKIIEFPDYQNTNAHSSPSKINYSQDKHLTPNFDNNVLADDPFGRKARNRRNFLLEDTPSPVKYQNGLVSHLSYENSVKQNNLNKYQKSSQALNFYQKSNNASNLNVNPKMTNTMLLEPRTKPKISNFKTGSRPSLSSSEIDLSRDPLAETKLRKMEEMMYQKLGLGAISNNNSKTPFETMPNNSNIFNRNQTKINEFRLPDAPGVTEAKNYESSNNQKGSSLSFDVHTPQSRNNAHSLNPSRLSNNLVVGNDSSPGKHSSNSKPRKVSDFELSSNPKMLDSPQTPNMMKVKKENSSPLHLMPSLVYK